MRKFKKIRKERNQKGRIREVTNSALLVYLYLKTKAWSVYLYLKAKPVAVIYI